MLCKPRSDRKDHLARAAAEDTISLDSVQIENLTASRDASVHSALKDEESSLEGCSELQVVEQGLREGPIVGATEEWPQ